MIVFRQALLSDIDEVNNIEQSCFKNPYSLDELKYEFNENPVSKIIVAESDGRIIGFIDFLITFNSSTIMQIAVDKKFRRQKIATNLLMKMEETFPKNSEDIVEFSTLEVRKSNTAAIELYKSFGYEIITEKKQYYKDGEDAIYMVKRL